jgi:hypothetical protein
MGRRCSVCGNKNLYRIDFLLINNVEYSRIAQKYCPKGTKKENFQRAIERHHKAGHIPLPDQKAHDDAEVKRGLDLEKLLEETVQDLKDTAKEARGKEKYQAAASCYAQVIRSLEFALEKDEIRKLREELEAWKAQQSSAGDR